MEIFILWSTIPLPFLLMILSYCENVLLSISSSCTGLDWDYDGDVLAIISEKSSSIYLWKSHFGEGEIIESGLRFVMKK